MRASRMTVREQARQRDRVAALLLLDGADSRLVRDAPVDPGSYKAAAAVGCGRGALLAERMRGLSGTGRRSVDARSAR
jgi:hypothetical protein